VGHDYVRYASKNTAIELAAMLGISVRYAESVLAFAHQHRMLMLLRPANPSSVPHAEIGATPKPESIKSKTVNRDDLFLRDWGSEMMPELYQRYGIIFPEGSDTKPVMSPLGLVGHFDPDEKVMYNFLHGLTAKERQRLILPLSKRLEQRRNEYNDPELTRKYELLIERGRLIHHANSLLLIRKSSRSFMPMGNEGGATFSKNVFPVCGDLDPYAIYLPEQFGMFPLRSKESGQKKLDLRGRDKLHDVWPILDRYYKQFLSLFRQELGGQHGTHDDWMTKNKLEEIIHDKIEKSVLYGDETLAYVAPYGKCGKVNPFKVVNHPDVGRLLSRNSGRIETIAKQESWWHDFIVEWVV